MRSGSRAVVVGGLLVLSAACNSGAPEPVSMTMTTPPLRLTIVRTATDPFLPRYNLTLTVEADSGCSSTTELFPDTGHAGRRNIYLAPRGMVYVVGQFDARVIDPGSCLTTLSEFRHLERDVVFVGSFDDDSDRRWAYYPASERSEHPLGSR